MRGILDIFLLLVYLGFGALFVSKGGISALTEVGSIFTSSLKTAKEVPK